MMRITKKVPIIGVLVLFILHFNAFSHEYSGELYQNLIFKGGHIIYKGEKIELNAKTFFIDGGLSNEQAAKYKYVFNSINEASRHLTNGTESCPMVLYIAPWVYWVDDPDDPAIRKPKEGGNTPFGLEISCEWLKFYGLSDNAQDVVLACNRGQTMGAKGNFTMLNISGQGTSAENITFGNYCNIDLEYPLKPELNREKRGSAIVQAQLIFCNGDKIFARNTRFISRLNLCPFVGGKRTLFDHCHFESTDDALNGNAVYLNCTFDFYSGKPFWGTHGTGAVLLNCDIKSFTRGEQYLIKSAGPITIVNTRMESETASYWGWQKKPAFESRNYQFNNLFNGNTTTVGAHNQYATVDMGNKNVLYAYCFEYNREIVYNTYNLLRGNDDWDPMGIKPLVLAAEKKLGKKLLDIPTQLTINPTRIQIETGKDTLTLAAQVNKFGNFIKKGIKINWSVAPRYQKLVKLNPNKNGTCDVIPINNEDKTKEAIILASTPDGLEAASVINVLPTFLPPPNFTVLPKIVKSNNGQLSVGYKLNMRFADQSLVTWYRCSDKKGSNLIEVAVSRFNKPKQEYQLTAGDVGYYLMVSVQPKHIRCNPGIKSTDILDEPISAQDVKTDSTVLIADFMSMPSKYQPEVIPGSWTLDSYAPDDTREYNWEADNSHDPWYYGTGVNGAANDTGFVQAVKGARLRYTPVGNNFGNMKISFTAVPAKTAGQGFSSARAQYLDICLKFDTEKLNGYGLRLIRTTKYHNAIDCYFVKYENGNAIQINKPVSISCYRTPCYITVEAKGEKLIAHAETPAGYYKTPNRPEVAEVLNMEAGITSNNYGGIQLQHTGTVHSGATLVKDFKVEWE